jgi:hypothetical protein
MTLQDGAIFITPDGRRFRAKLEIRNYAPDDPAWTFVPADQDPELDSRDTWRDKTGRMLFVESGMIVQLDFETAAIAVDTGWTVEDLRAEPSRGN